MAFNMHRIKRQARKEAWYGDSYNPFKKPASRRTDDVEGGSEDYTHPSLTRWNVWIPGRTELPIGPDGTIDVDGVDTESEEIPQRRPWHKGRDLKHSPFTLRNQVQTILFYSWVRVLLLLTPVGIAAHYLRLSATIDFLVNFFAILPLTDIFGQSLVEFKMQADPRLEWVAYILLGNINQILISVFLLRSQQVAVLKSTLIGGMLLRILFMTSIAIVTSDKRHRIEKREVAVSLSKHLGIATTGLLIPTALSMTTGSTNTDVNKQSRVVSIVLLILYALYLFSKWKTYNLLGFQRAESREAAKEAREARERERRMKDGSFVTGIAYTGFMGATIGLPKLNDMPSPKPPPVEETTLSNLIMNPRAYEEEQESEDGEVMPQLHMLITVITIVFMVVLLALHGLFISDSIKGISANTGMSLEFIGLIMLLFLGVDSTMLHLDNRFNSDENTKTMLGLGLQAILFVMPVLVLVSWMVGIEDMNLFFSPFEVTVLFPATLIVQASIEETDNGWLSGALLFSSYVIIAIAAWFQK